MFATSSLWWILLKLVLPSSLKEVNLVSVDSENYVLVWIFVILDF